MKHTETIEYFYNKDHQIVKQVTTVEEQSSKDKELVTLSKEKFDKMQKEIDFLNALEAAGVDNWSGYEFAHKMYEEHHGEEYC